MESMELELRALYKGNLFSYREYGRWSYARLVAALDEPDPDPALVAEFKMRTRLIAGLERALDALQHPSLHGFYAKT